MIGRLKLWLAGIGAFIVAMAMAFWRGKTRQKDEGYADTRNRIDQADVGDDPDMARRWLRERGKR